VPIDIRTVGIKPCKCGHLLCLHGSGGCMSNSQDTHGNGCECYFRVEENSRVAFDNHLQWGAYKAFYYGGRHGFYR